MKLSGDDATATARRAMGGDSCISVTTNLAPRLRARLHRAWDGGDLDEVGRVRGLLAPLHDALFVECNRIPVKTTLAMARFAKVTCTCR